MNRRNFIQLLGAGAVAMVLDHERLLWVPGRKTIFLPSPKVLLPQDYWVGHRLTVIEGTMAGQSRMITAYNPNSRTMTFDLPFPQPLKPFSDTYEILPVPYLAGLPPCRLQREGCQPP